MPSIINFDQKFILLIKINYCNVKCNVSLIVAYQLFFLI